MKIEDKSKKTLVILVFIIVACLSALNQLKVATFFNIINGSTVTDVDGIEYIKYAYFFVLFLGSFLSVFWVKGVWNFIIPRVSGWRRINYLEAMALTVFIMLFSLL